ncbi:MAG: hypothetical protein KAJ29_04720 [Alphaproteobacteria bacterium]|nr:hypothetical protein [Alphaproteobacteria bacterium]
MTREWNALEMLEKAVGQVPSGFVAAPGVPRQIPDNEPVPLAVLEDALTKAAMIVERFGADFLPVFERAERELETAQKRADAMTRVSRIAARYISADGKSLSNHINVT